MQNKTRPPKIKWEDNDTFEVDAKSSGYKFSGTADDEEVVITANVCPDDDPSVAGLDSQIRYLTDLKKLMIFIGKKGEWEQDFYWSDGDLLMRVTLKPKIFEKLFKIKIPTKNG